AELERLGELAEPALRKTLAAQPSLELRQRIERLLERLVTWQPPSADLVRAIRSVDVLERIGTSEAKQLLEQLAHGAASAQLTTEAQASLNRMANQGANMPVQQKP